MTISSLGPEPSYCKLHLGALSPSQWTTCFKYGWNEPTNLAARLGHDVGHNVLAVLIIVAVVIALAVRGLSRI